MKLVDMPNGYPSVDGGRDDSLVGELIRRLSQDYPDVEAVITFTKTGASFYLRSNAIPEVFTEAFLGTHVEGSDKTVEEII